MTNSNVLVLGGTGRTGGRIVRRLRDRGIQARVASRRGREPFRWEDRATWDVALRGASAAYLCYSPDLAFPGVAEMIGEFAGRARNLGVDRMVLLSGRGEAGARASEKAVQETAAQWTVIRSSWFAQNFSEHFLLGPTLRGRLVLPAGDVREPFIDIDDLAEIASAALTEDGHAGTVYEVTGPRLLSMHDVAAEISAAAGRNIEYVPGTAEEFVADVARDGVRPDDARPLAELFESILDGRNASIATGVESALGRPATDFTDYARRAAASGIWNPRIESRA
ncbi:NmrA family transcriptional regulator [Paeniglutamicibacter sp. MACA_103]|uniref:NmrA family transcriptional regulator n=1 Tax=Paeniglutamicibacter sp. MACA_103 TaxID=3377337 RepID=UPI0038933D86